jgi:hypothetical protein
MVFTKIATCALAVASASAFPFGQRDVPHDARYYRRQAAAAYEAKDYNSALDSLKKAAELIPDHPSIIYGIASMHALLGNEAKAIAALRKVVEMGLALHPERDADFEAIKNGVAFKTIVAGFKANSTPVVRSTTAFTLPEKGLVTEGIAYDPVDDRFYISSIHKRKILSRDRVGKITTLASEADGLWSVLGMKIDAGRRLLWATTTAFPQMVNFRKELDGSSAILKFDLRTGKLIRKYPVPDANEKHGLGDLVINRAGDVFASDSTTPAIYVIRHDRDAIVQLIGGESFLSPQGLAFSSDERHLFMADYGKGIFDINVATGGVDHLSPAPGTTSLGIDGLYYHNGYLIGVQNGITPNRLVKLELDTESKRIKRLEVLEANNPLFDEPTLGVLIKDSLAFIANSQWGSVDENGRLASEDKLKEPIVLKLRLP